MAAGALWAGYGRFGDTATKPAGSHPDHALPQFPPLSSGAEASPFPRLLGSRFCASRAASLASPPLLNVSQHFKASQLALGLASSPCGPAPRSEPRRSGDKPQLCESSGGELARRPDWGGCQLEPEEPQCRRVLGMRSSAVVCHCQPSAHPCGVLRTYGMSPCRFNPLLPLQPQSYPSPGARQRCTCWETNWE